MKIIIIFLKSFFIQTLMHKDYMQKYGFKFLTNNKINMVLNTNPYFVNIVYGLYYKENNINKNEMRMIVALCAMMGDNLIWNFLKPVILLISIFALYSQNMFVIISMFLIYNFYITFLRTYGFYYGIKKSYNKSQLFNEWYFKKLSFYLKYIKLFFLGIGIGYLILGIVITK